MGATVLHEHPFGDLPSHFRVDIENESNVFWAKWIADYYLCITCDYPEDWVWQMRKLKRELNEEIIIKALHPKRMLRLMEIYGEDEIYKNYFDDD